MFAKILFVTISLLALSASAAPALDIRGTAALAPAQVARAYLCNCYTNPEDGTRSEIEFYEQQPTFGSATYANVVVVSDGINEVWENGGSVAFGGDTFTWAITAANVSAVPYGLEVGNANFAEARNEYTLIRESLPLLYQQGIYTAVLSMRPFRQMCRRG